MLKFLPDFFVNIVVGAVVCSVMLAVGFFTYLVYLKSKKQKQKESRVFEIKAGREYYSFTNVDAVSIHSESTDSVKVVFPPDGSRVLETDVERTNKPFFFDIAACDDDLLSLVSQTPPLTDVPIFIWQRAVSSGKRVWKFYIIPHAFVHIHGNSNCRFFVNPIRLDGRFSVFSGVSKKKVSARKLWREFNKTFTES